MKNHQQRKSSNRKYLIWGIIILGLLLRIYVFSLHQVIDSDGAYYAKLGENLISGNGYTEPEGTHQWYYPPLYPLNIGIIWQFTNNLEFSSKLVSLIYGTLILLIVFLLSNKIYGERTAIIATALAAFHPNLIRFSSTNTAESQFIFLILLAIYFLVVKINNLKIFHAAIIGILLGLAFLTKPAAIQYAFGAVIVIVFAGFLMGLGKKNTLKAASIVVILFVSLALPYMIYLKNHYGYWTLSELSTRNLARSLLQFSGDNPEKVYQLNDDGTELKYFTSRDYPGEHISISQLFKDNPKSFLKRYLFNFIQEVKFLADRIPSIMVLVLIIVICGHFYFMPWNKKSITNELTLAIMLIPFFSAPLISTNSSRWVLPMIPVLMIWIANGLNVMGNRFFGDVNKKRSFLPSSALVLAAIFLWAVTTTFPFIKSAESFEKMYPHEHKQMGRWMSENLILKKSDTVLSPSPHVAFYAGIKLKIMPWGTDEDIINYARQKKVDYLIVDDHFLGQARSQLQYFQKIDDGEDNLKRINKINHPNGKMIKLYRLLY